MDAITKNELTITKPFFHEAYIATSGRKYRRTALKTTLILLGLWLTFFLIMSYVMYNPTYLPYALTELAMIGFIGLWTAFILPHNKCRQDYQKLSNLSSIVTRTTIFYENHLEVITETGAITTILYIQVIRIQETKNLIILHCTDGIGVLLSKNGFIDGDINTIMTLINKQKENLYD